MILYPVGTKVWYFPLKGERIATEVQAHEELKGRTLMSVYLPGDPGPALVHSNRLAVRDA